MTAYILTLAALCLTGLVVLALTDRAYHVGRRLIAAAGSYKEAERAIVATQALRDVNEAMKAKQRRAVSNVVALRLTNRGAKVNFERGDGHRD